MSKKDLVSEEVLQELINKLEEIVNNYCYNLEYFTPTDIEGFFDGTQQEIDYYSSLIKDDVVSKNFLHSSKQIADDIAKSILEANEYTDSLLKNISSIQLEWCETNLPTTGENNKIYILPVTSGSTTTVNTLNIWNNTSNDWVSIGNLEIDITQFYNKSEIDTKMDLKANKTEVVANDKIVQTLDSATNSSDTVLSTSGLQVEMDKKIDKNTFIKLNDLPNGSYCKINSFIQNNNEFVALDIVKSDGTINRLELTNAGDTINHIHYDGTNWTKIGRVCTTNVADIPTTTITPTLPSTVKIGKMHFIRYSVKNGWANVSIIMHLDSAPKTDWFPIANNLPKPDKEINFSTIGESTANIAPIAFRLEKLDDGRTLEMMVGAEFTVPNWYNVNFSYPVAES